ncbi:hypothetical protein, partial [Salmonella sp. SAL4431]|uniref:hypothetical protein n=1 Tax=Salmonella sp. SAL4431 TaxID=3159886 RepID=UPI00397AB2F7
MNIRVESRDTLHQRRTVHVGGVDSADCYPRYRLSKTHKFTRSSNIRLELRESNSWHRDLDLR